MAFSVEAKFDTFMLQTFSFQALSHSGPAQNVYRALFEHSGAHTRFDIFARLPFKNHGLDSLQMQQVGKCQPGGPGTDDSNLCAKFRH
jgi:hypothetical protein